MSCCGGRRTMWPTQAPMRASAPAAARAGSPAAEQRPLLRLVYEYVGPTSLTVSSPHTGRRYRFDRPGARVELDPRDRPLVAQVSQLRQVL